MNRRHNCASVRAILENTHFRLTLINSISLLFIIVITKELLPSSCAQKVKHPDPYARLRTICNKNTQTLLSNIIKVKVQTLISFDG
ncbi:unnamed protein product [Acanthoscelides obtectus]|uniref:Uncharacterized protein n=1 Tax=Acanthoscelides obtectus TaxID=200917 RepID=A0A9P0JJH3_ACAOB|nr:unnamed protein product [Acanthoscelides obtectus]CAK1639697.1 hypothetical protein AOBTE_LOCUS11322 [Acanthoscelides obtectus]